MRVKSFGCSFIFGNELSDDGYGSQFATPSQLTWPALIARELGAEYQCYAKPGAGNFRILEQIMHQAGLDNSDTIYIIGWTWIERFDYITQDHTSTDKISWQTITPISVTPETEYYYRNFHTELRDKLQSLIYIRTAIDLLRMKEIPFVMTCIDDLVLDRRWHIPVSITDTQDYVQPHIQSFQGHNFLDWARQNNFPMGQWLHPLDDAHHEAFKLMLPVVQNLQTSPLGI